MAMLGEGAGAGGEFGGDGGVGSDPVRKGVFTVLDDAVGGKLVDGIQEGDICRGSDVRFAGLVSIVGVTGFTRSNWGIIYELQEVLSIAGDNSDFLAVLTERIELVGECRLELLTGDVGQLGLCD